MARIAGQGSNWIRRSTRLAIYHRDGHRCVYCGCKVRPGRKTNGTSAAHLDHVLACELGGSSKASNLVTACRHCNDAKSTLSVKAFLKLLRAKGANVRTLAARIRKAVNTPLTPALRALGRADAAKGL